MSHRSRITPLPPAAPVRAPTVPSPAAAGRPEPDNGLPRLVPKSSERSRPRIAFPPRALYDRAVAPCHAEVRQSAPGQPCRNPARYGFRRASDRPERTHGRPLVRLGHRMPVSRGVEGRWATARLSATPTAELPAGPCGDRHGDPVPSAPDAHHSCKSSVPPGSSAPAELSRPWGQVSSSLDVSQRAATLPGVVVMAARFMRETLLLRPVRIFREA